MEIIIKPNADVTIQGCSLGGMTNCCNGSGGSTRENG